MKYARICIAAEADVLLYPTSNTHFNRERWTSLYSFLYCNISCIPVSSPFTMLSEEAAFQLKLCQKVSYFSFEEKEKLHWRVSGWLKFQQIL